MTYHVITASYNCMRYLPRCLTSIDRQKYDDFKVCVVDDHSPDPDQAPFIQAFCEKRGWEYILNDRNRGALYSQVHAIMKLDPDAEDVVVYLDGDDQFATDDVFSILDQYYADEDTWMTYGNYLPVPSDQGCPEVQPYPKNCERDCDYRDIYKFGIRFNHLRTHKAKLFYALDKSDFTNGNGEWFDVAGDTAMMIPCLELADGRYAVVDEVLVFYTSDSEQADWRLYPNDIDRIHGMIAKKPRKSPM